MAMQVEEQAFSGWDKGLDFDAEKARLEQFITQTRNRRKKVFYCILLVQLVNGARIGEAVDAAIQYAKNGKREQRVRVEKRKDKYMRLMIIPDVVRKYVQVREGILDMDKEYASFKDTARKFCERHMGYNSHAQRYAFIGKMSNIMHPQQIARLTGHTKLDLILHYTQARLAEAKHREIVK